LRSWGLWGGGGIRKNAGEGAGVGNPPFSWQSAERNLVIGRWQARQSDILSTKARRRGKTFKLSGKRLGGDETDVWRGGGGLEGGCASRRRPVWMSWEAERRESASSKEARFCILGRKECKAIKIYKRYLSALKRKKTKSRIAGGESVRSGGVWEKVLRRLLRQVFGSFPQKKNLNQMIAKTRGRCA